MSPTSSTDEDRPGFLLAKGSRSSYAAKCVTQIQGNEKDELQSADDVHKESRKGNKVTRVKCVRKGKRVILNGESK